MTENRTDNKKDKGNTKQVDMRYPDQGKNIHTCISFRNLRKILVSLEFRDVWITAIVTG